MYCSHFCPWQVSLSLVAHCGLSTTWMADRFHSRPYASSAVCCMSHDFLAWQGQEEALFTSPSCPSATSRAVHSIVDCPRRAFPLHGRRSAGEPGHFDDDTRCILNQQFRRVATSTPVTPVHIAVYTILSMRPLPRGLVCVGPSVWSVVTPRAQGSRARRTFPVLLAPQETPAGVCRSVYTCRYRSSSATFLISRVSGFGSRRS